MVGSSSAVLSTKLGEEVDRHDTVVRCNCGPTVGFEAHVGRRTTFHVVNEQSDPRVGRIHDPAATTTEDTSLSATVVALPILRRDNFSDFALQTATHSTCRESSPMTGHQTVFVNFDFLMSLRTKFGLSHPTTGFTAIALFSQMFTRPVTLHGFSFFTEGSVHYWVNHTDTDACGHRFVKSSDQAAIRANAYTFHNASHERRIISQMAARGLITFLSHNKKIRDGDEPSANATKAGPRDHRLLMRGWRSSGSTHGMQNEETCLTACVATRKTSPESCQWKPLASLLEGQTHRSGGSWILPSLPNMLSSGCLPPPSCCTDWRPVPRYHLFRRMADDAFVLLGHGHCHRGVYSAWDNDPPEVRADLHRCLSTCKAETHCRYVAFLFERTCSRYDEGAEDAGCCEALISGNVSRLHNRSIKGKSFQSFEV